MLLPGKKRKRPLSAELDTVIGGIKDAIWSMSRLYHGTQHHFYDAREILYAEYEQQLPTFVSHHKGYYGPEAPEWRQRWSRCFSTWGIPCDDNCRCGCCMTCYLVMCGVAVGSEVWNADLHLLHEQVGSRSQVPHFNATIATCVGAAQGQS